MASIEAPWAALLHACVPVAFMLGIALPAAALLRRRLTAHLHRSTAAGGAGPRGLLQPWADGIKLITKRPARRAPLTWSRALALWLALAAPLTVLALFPYGPRPGAAASSGADLSVMILMALMAASAVVPAVLGAAGAPWGDPAGEMRGATHLSTAMLCVALCLTGVAWMAHSPRLGDITAFQGSAEGALPLWNVLLQPLGFVVCAGALIVWCQVPLCAAGGSVSALSGGYGSASAPAEMAWLRVAGYLRQLCAAVLLAGLYLGGGHLPWGAYPGLVSAWSRQVAFAIFGFKALAILAGFIWFGATLPSLRWDRLQHLLWRRFLPLAVANLAWVGLLSMVLGP